MAIQFASLSSAEGLKELDTYLLTHSYITGYQASKDDLAVYVALTSAPDSSSPNAARWYNHITHLLADNFNGEAKGVSVGASVSAAAPAVASREIAAPAPAEPEPAPAAAAPAADDEDDDDDDLDLFGEATEEEKQAQAARAAEAGKKEKKKVIGKSSVLLDIKPWDDETDMVKLEASVRAIQMEGLTWGASKLVAVGYGIKKLTIMMTIVDDLVSLDELIEDHLQSEGSECAEHIQSCDIVAFNKI